MKYKIKYNQLKNLLNLNGGGRISNEDKKKADIKNLKKFFVEAVNNIQKFELVLKPFVEYYDENQGKFIKNQMNDKVKKLFSKKIKSNYKDMLFEIFQFNFDKIEYDEKLNELHLIFFPEPNDFKTITQFMWKYKDSYNLDDFISFYARFFHDNVESGPDTWMSGDIVYFNRGEIDNNEYLFNIDYVNLIAHLKYNESDIKKNKIRPSPSDSATLFKVGTIKKGNDGNKWIITEDKNKVKRWKKL